MNTSLLDLQHQFQDFLLDKSVAFEKSVCGKTKILSKQRLSIYHQAYRLRLIGILKIDFPALEQWLGANKFEKLALAYIDNYPSRFFSARNFGQYMASWLAETAPYNKDAFLSEFAHFERTLSEAIDIPDAPLLTTEYVMSIPPEKWGNLSFDLHPTVALCEFHWNIPQIRQELLTNQHKLPKRSQSVSCLVWRKKVDVCYKLLDPKECFILKAIAQKITFEDICVGLTEYLPEEDAAPYIVQFLQRWLPEEIFSKTVF